MSVDPVIVATVRVLLALLFATAAWHKLADITAFRIVLHDYHVLPASLVAPATLLVVGTEVVLAATLPWPVTARVSGRVAMLLLATYGVAIAVNLIRGRRTLECGCAPSAYRQPLSEWLLVRNAALIGACGVALLPSTARSWSGVDWLTLAGAIATGAMTWAAATRLLALANLASLFRGVAR